MTESTINSVIPTQATELANLLAQLKAKKESDKLAKLERRTKAAQVKKDRPKIATSGGRTLSAEIKKTKKNEDGTESESKGAISIWGLNRLPFSIYAENVIPLIGYLGSEQFASALDRDAENASFQFGDKDDAGKSVSEKGTARTLEKMQKISAIIRKLAPEIQAILNAELAPETEDAANDSVVSEAQSTDNV